MAHATTADAEYDYGVFGCKSFDTVKWVVVNGCCGCGWEVGTPWFGLVMHTFVNENKNENERGMMIDDYDELGLGYL